MKFSRPLVFASLLGLFISAATFAQTGGASSHRASLSIGGGFLDRGLNLFDTRGAGNEVAQGKKLDDDAEFYYVGLRFRVKEHSRRLLIEPEITYWESEDPGLVSVEDISVGANLIFLSPLRGWDLFWGVGAAAHFLDQSIGDTDPDRANPGIPNPTFDDSTSIGLNSQLGAEIHMTESSSFTAFVRYDWIDKYRTDGVVKVGIGVRFGL